MTVVRRGLALLASAALSLSLAGPATASVVASGVPAWVCAPKDIAAAAAGFGAQARGGGMREQDTGQIARDTPRSAKGRAPSDFSVTVRVYWHVVTDGAAGAVTDAQIRSQLSVLNGAFSSSAGFTFTLAAVTRTDDAVWYQSQSAGAEHEMKRALKQGG